jgi:hypothetical protein
MKEEEIKEIVYQALDKAYQYFSQNDFPNAEELYRQILRVDPTNIIALQMIILALCKNKNFEDAKLFITKAINLHPNDYQIYNNAGLTYGTLEDHQLAIGYFEKAISLNPEPFLYTNLALEYKKMGDINKCYHVFQGLLDKNINSEHVYFNYGSFVHGLGDLDHAIKLYSKAIEINSAFAAAHYNLAICYLLSGKYLEGWKEYEWRWEQFAHFAGVRKRFTQPYWDGRHCDKLLLYTEQGVGDTLMFARYIPLVKERVGEVIFECVPELTPILRDFVTIEESPKEFDAHCSLLSLPGVFGTTLENIPEPLSYTSQSRWDQFKDYFKIGICWSGSPNHPNDKNRSIPLKLFRPIHDLPGVKLFSLQKHNVVRNDGTDLCLGTEGMKIVDLSENMTDWGVTAFIVENMDLIITADTAIAHLSASMGKPTRILLPTHSDWRWLLKGNTTPWYPSATLYRSEGNWEEIIASSMRGVLNWQG